MQSKQVDRGCNNHLPNCEERDLHGLEAFKATGLNSFAIFFLLLCICPCIGLTRPKHPPKVKYFPNIAASSVYWPLRPKHPPKWKYSLYIAILLVYWPSRTTSSSQSEIFSERQADGCSPPLHNCGQLAGDRDLKFDGRVGGLCPHLLLNRFHSILHQPAWGDLQS